MDRNDRTSAKQILLALGYTDQFSYPLRRSEIKERMLALLPSEGFAKNSLQTVEQVLKKLQSSGLVKQRDSFFSLVSKHNSAKQLSTTRTERTKHAKRKRAESKELIEFLAKIPWISGVLITGSVAMNNATADDDVDFLIITKPHSLWLVRPLVVAYAWYKRKRRSWKREEKNSWCFNFWLEETQLGLPKQKRTIYTAYELLQAEWVLAEPRVFRQYYTTNLWARSLLPEMFERARQPKPHIEKSTELLKSNKDIILFFYYPVLWINVALYWLQIVYMLPHRTSERVGKSFAFFHPRDTHSQVFENWKSSLKRLVYIQ